MEVIVGYDDANSDVLTTRRYFDFLGKYNILGIGHNKNGTSSIFLPDGFDLKRLPEELGDIPILEIIY